MLTFRGLFGYFLVDLVRDRTLRFPPARPRISSAVGSAQIPFVCSPLIHWIRRHTDRLEGNPVTIGRVYKYGAYPRIFLPGLGLRYGDSLGSVRILADWWFLAKVQVPNGVFVRLFQVVLSFR